MTEPVAVPPAPSRRKLLIGSAAAVAVAAVALVVFVLTIVVVLLNLWRGTRSFAASAFYANLALMAGGFALMGYQLTGYFTS